MSTNKLTSGRHIILFGLSADPLHMGHIAYMRFVMDMYPHDLLVMMPCNLNPISKVVNGLTVHATAGLLRYEMIREVIQTYFPARNIMVSEHEVNQKGHSYTYKTVDYLRQLIGSKGQISLLLGTDNLQQLPQWTKPQYIIGCVHTVLVASRAGSLQSFAELIHDDSRCLHVFPSWKACDDLADFMGDLLLVGRQLFYVPQTLLAQEITDVNHDTLQTLLGGRQCTSSKLLLTANEVTDLLPNRKKYPTFREIFYRLGKIELLDGPQYAISSRAIRATAASVFKKYVALDLSVSKHYQSLHQALQQALAGRLASCTIATLCRLYVEGQIAYGPRYEPR